MQFEEILEELQRDSLTEADLSWRTLDDEKALALANALRHNKQLTRLDIHLCKFSEEGIQGLSKAIRRNSTLTAIDIHQSKIGDEMGRVIAKALKRNKTIKSINFSGNEFGEVAGIAFAEALGYNKMLTAIDLSSNPFGDSAGAALCTSLQQNSTLKSVNFSMSKFGDKTAQALSQTLAGSSNLSAMDLSSNRFSEAGIVALAKALQSNHSLTAIKLGGIQLTDAMGIHFANALRMNECLHSMNLSWNKLGPESAVALAGALGCNETLKSLSLQSCEFTDSEAILFASALQNNYALTSLDLRGNGIDQSILDNLNDIFKRNVKAKGDPRLISQHKNNSGASESGSSSYMLAPQFSSPSLLSGFIVVSPQEAGKIERGDLLGTGSYGTVFKSQWRGMDVAVKEFHAKVFNSDEVEEFQRESAIMGQARSKQIVSLYAISLNPYCMIMEYMPGGTLYQFLRSPAEIPWDLRTRLALEIIRGLLFLHNAQIYHRDLKSLNILLDERQHAKITDFGLSKVKKTNSISSANAVHGVGTIPWMAPELFKRNGKYTEKSDIHSYGMVVWELASRRIPFSDAHDSSLIPVWIQQGETEDIPSDTPENLVHVIKECWHLEPERRPSAQQIADFLENKTSTLSIPAIDCSETGYMLKSNVGLQSVLADDGYVANR